MRQMPACYVYHNGFLSLLPLSYAGDRHNGRGRKKESRNGFRRGWKNIRQMRECCMCFERHREDSHDIFRSLMWMILNINLSISCCVERDRPPFLSLIENNPSLFGLRRWKKGNDMRWWWGGSEWIRLIIINSIDAWTMKPITVEYYSSQSWKGRPTFGYHATGGQPTHRRPESMTLEAVKREERTRTKFHFYFRPRYHSKLDLADSLTHTFSHRPVWVVKTTTRIKF